MQCIGRTGQKKRCRNNAKFLFCHKHVWQPLTAGAALLTTIGFGAGFFQDAVKPLAEKIALDEELRKPVAVELKTNRRTVAEWEQNPELFTGKSDVVTILLDRQPKKTLEVYHTAKDQRFKEYPPTFPLADFFLPTAVDSQVVDLDRDGVSEIVLVLTNQIYSLHFDKQVNVLIYSPVGQLLARTPYPRDVPGLKIDLVGPYSAYRTTAVMRDAISEATESTTFANDFSLVTRDGTKYLQFSWVIDNASYAGVHLHQVEEFQYVGGKLQPSGNPGLYISEGWEGAASGQPVTTMQQARDFLDKHNQPDFPKLLKQSEAELREQGYDPDAGISPKAETKLPKPPELPTLR
jgi:hypothetical protein